MTSFPVTDPNQAIFLGRQKRLASELDHAKINFLVLNPGPSLTYLTGLHFHLMERPVVAYFPPSGPVTLVIPALEAAKTEALPFPARVYTYGEDPETWPAVFREAAQAAQIEGLLGVEPTQIRYLELCLIEAASPEIKMTSAEDSLAELRMRKDAEELSLMRKAVDIAQRALENTLPTIQVGMSERQVAAELTLQLLRAGSDSQMPFAPIVSGGPNSANPHATPSDRPLAPGDLLVIDWGAYYEGYCSDLTRTFAIGEVDPEFRRIAEIVRQANEAGRQAAAPGVPAGQVDTAARSVIEQAGYGVYFRHRTGHGLGMQGHEPPYIRAGNPLVLEPGMTFTVEPGVYLLNRNGVRIEDNVVITEVGSETLSNLPRELITLGSNA
jgi:Xaa-Pro dipeptidase